MARLSGPTRHMFTAFLTASTLAAIAYLVLRPVVWRPHLLHILDRGFASFTQYLGTNGPGWVVSVVGSSIFTIIATLALVGLVRGSAAMKQHWKETALIAMLALVGQVVLVYGPIYLRKVTETVFKDHQGLVSANAQLRADKQGLLSKLDAKPKEITKLVSPPREPRKCSHYTLAVPAHNEVVPDSEYGETIFLYCNQETAHPFNVTLEFSTPYSVGVRAQILGSQSSLWQHGRGVTLQSNIFSDSITSESLAAYQPVVVTVYSKNEIRLKSACLGGDDTCRPIVQ